MLYDDCVETPFVADDSPLKVQDKAALTELVEKYCERHRTVENFILIYFLIFGLLRRIGLDPMNGPRPWLGRLAVLVLVQGAFVGAPFGISLMLGEPAPPFAVWSALGLCFGVLLVALHDPLGEAIDNFLWLARSIADEPGIRRLMEWEKRWFRRAVSAPLSLLFGLAVLAYLNYIENQYGEPPVPRGTVLVGFSLLYGVGEIVYSVLLLACESHVLRDCDYEVYRLSPLDSVAMRRAMRGSTQIGLIVSLVATLFIVGFVVLLEDRPIMVSRVGLLLLGLAYLATLAGLLMPRLAIKSIVLKEKESELLPLQNHLDSLVKRARELNEDGYKELKRLKETHDAIRDANEEVLPLRAIGRLAGALILPTMTFLFTRFGESFLQGILRR